MSPVKSNRKDSSDQAQNGAPKSPDSERFEPLLGSIEAAKLLQIHPKTLQKMARAGTVPAHLICGLWRFRASELDRWLKAEVSSKSHSCSN
jgi:excisionase family DNA binding protein